MVRLTRLNHAPLVLNSPCDYTMSKRGRGLPGSGHPSPLLGEY